MNDWLDHYCQRHRSEDKRFGPVDWFITFLSWIALAGVAAAIGSFIIGAGRWLTR